MFSKLGEDLEPTSSQSLSPQNLKVFHSKVINQVLEKEGQSSGVGAKPTLCEIF